MGRAGQLTQTEVCQGIIYSELEVQKKTVMQFYSRKRCRESYGFSSSS